VVIGDYCCERVRRGSASLASGTRLAGNHVVQPIQIEVINRSTLVVEDDSQSAEKALLTSSRSARPRKEEAHHVCLASRIVPDRVDKMRILDEGAVGVDVGDPIQ
jgi:hypothetical protein